MQSIYKKLIILSVLFISTLIVSAQLVPENTFVKDAFIPQYTLTVSDQVTTVLIFPAAISKNGVDLGSPDIIASAVDGIANILKVKAVSPGISPTNLTVITNDGKIYSFWLTYGEKADSRPIDISTQVGEEIKRVKLVNRKLTDQEIADLAKHIATRKPFMNTARARSFGVKASLEGIYIVSGVLFFQLDLTNKTNIDYTTDFVRYYIRAKKRAKRTADHEEELKPLYAYYAHGKVTAGKTSQQLVLAFPKFTIADQKNFVIQIFEKNGDRHLELKISGNEIINALNLNPITE